MSLDGVEQKDCILGAWACNFTAASSGEVYAANITFAEGGSFVCDVDISHQRPFEGVS